MDLELVGSAEIAARLDISQSRVNLLAGRDDFPTPLAELTMGRVWAWSDVEAWARTTGRLS